jgi:AcrR family transcriptional regulator
MWAMARSYSSPARAAQALRTRAEVVVAAHDLFVSQGWVATTMAGVAERAGVARQTVYLMFESKQALLDVCIDQRLRGNEADAPVRTQPGYQAMGTGTTTERVSAGARWLAGAHERSATIQRVLDQAAVTDPAAAARLHEREQGRWQEVAFAVGLVLGAKPAREFVDLVWTLASRDVWLKLVEQRGWTSARWQAWFEAALTAAIGQYTDDTGAAT